MENKRNIRRWLPVAAALAVFVLINLFYFAPQFSGQTLLQGDVQQYKGSSEDIMQHREKYGEDPQWEGNMFGGMPAYLINVQYEGTVIKTLSKAFYFLGQPAALIFIAMTAFFFMLLCMRFNPWIGIVPSLAYGFSTYFFIIIGAGHVTKMMALAFAPMLFGGVWYAFRRNMWVGAALTGVFASIEIGVNHPQITYYFLFILAAFWINELVSAARAKALPRFAKTTGLLALAAVLAVGSNAGMLYYINSHSAETMRGGSELREARTGEKQQGLDIEYATAWSYGPGETFNLLIPNLYGGSSEGGFSEDGAVADALGKYNARQVAAHLPGYWGPQPGTSGPVYVGAAALLLAVLGLFVLRGRSKWWVAAVALLAVLLSWGNHFMGLTELFFRHFPMYNKFRTVSMILVIVEWCVPFLAAVVLQRIWCGRIEHARLMKGLKYSVLTVGGISLLFLLFGGALLSFSGGADDLGIEIDVHVDRKLVVGIGDDLHAALGNGINGLLGDMEIDAVGRLLDGSRRSDSLDERKSRAVENRGFGRIDVDLRVIDAGTPQGRHHMLDRPYPDAFLFYRGSARGIDYVLRQRIDEGLPFQIDSTETYSAAGVGRVNSHRNIEPRMQSLSSENNRSL